MLCAAEGSQFCEVDVRRSLNMLFDIQNLASLDMPVHAWGSSSDYMQAERDSVYLIFMTIYYRKQRYGNIRCALLQATVLK